MVEGSDAAFTCNSLLTSPGWQMSVADILQSPGVVKSSIWPRNMPLASLPSGLLGSPCRLIPYFFTLSGCCWVFSQMPCTGLRLWSKVLSISQGYHCGIQKNNLQLWAALGREKLWFVHFMSIYVLLLVPTPPWTDCQTYLPFNDEVTHSIRSSGQDLYA